VGSGGMALDLEKGDLHREGTKGPSRRLFTKHKEERRGCSLPQEAVNPGCEGEGQGLPEVVDGGHCPSEPLRTGWTQCWPGEA
jgi:hypothetical protein